MDANKRKFFSLGIPVFSAHFVIFEDIRAVCRRHEQKIFFLKKSENVEQFVLVENVLDFYPGSKRNDRSRELSHPRPKLDWITFKRILNRGLTTVRARCTGAWHKKTAENTVIVTCLSHDIMRTAARLWVPFRRRGPCNNVST